MRRYISNIDISNVSLGVGSGESLTTGKKNVLIGAYLKIYVGMPLVFRIRSGTGFDHWQ